MKIFLEKKCIHNRVKPHRIDRWLSPSSRDNHCQGATRKVLVKFPELKWWQWAVNIGISLLLWWGIIALMKWSASHL